MKIEVFVRCFCFGLLLTSLCAQTADGFGVESALDYLIGEKLLNFAKAADQDPDFAAELPRFQAAVFPLRNKPLVGKQFIEVAVWVSADARE